MENKLEKNDKPSGQEKLSTHNAKAQKVILIFGGILVSALILSMFVGGGTRAPKPVIAESEGGGQYDKASGFDQQLNYNKNRARYLNQDQDRLASLRAEQFGNKDPEDWRKKEELRVLNSRMVSFGFEQKQPNDNKTSSVINRGYSNFYGIQMSNPTRQTLPLTNAQVARLKQYFDHKNGNQNNLDTVGSNLVGHAIDDSYDGAVKNGKLLIPIGTVSSGNLDLKVVSDYLGTWQGILTNDVYSVNREFILLPKGTQIQGKTLAITNVNEAIQNKIGLSVDKAILPNGDAIDISKDAAVDRMGSSGVADQVNRHMLWQLFGVGAYAVMSASMPHDAYNNYGYVQPTYQGQFADGLRQQALPMVNKYLSLVPTVTLRQGTPFKIIIKESLYVKPWARVNQTVYQS